MAADHKRIINAKMVDVNKIVPIKYHWAWSHYLSGSNNHWMPQEVPMAADIALWRGDTLTPEERRIIKTNLGFFSTAESLVANNLTLAIYKHIHAPELRQYLLRQALEEAIHTHAFLYIVESLGLDEEEIFGMYHNLPSISNKDEFEMQLTADVLEDGFTTETFEGAQKFLQNLVGFYVIMEGIFFYAGFAMLLSFGRSNKMKGVAEQIQYIARDETVHLNFGIDTINGIKQENPELWTPQFQREVSDQIVAAVDLEKAYARDCLPKGMLGMRSSQFEKYVEYVADRRRERIGLPRIYKAKNPFPWMSETIDLPKEKNFFETRVTDYQRADALSWE